MTEYAYVEIHRVMNGGDTYFIDGELMEVGKIYKALVLRNKPDNHAIRVTDRDDMNGCWAKFPIGNDEAPWYRVLSPLEMLAREA